MKENPSTRAHLEAIIDRELHALTRYLKNMGVSVIHVDETSAVTGDFEVTSQNIGYLADTIVFLRHVEFRGELRKVIGD